jgi:hypothetical protein
MMFVALPMAYAASSGWKSRRTRRQALHSLAGDNSAFITGPSMMRRKTIGD